MERGQKARHGFTLIELLVVISIIALLIGILLPALGTARSVAQKIVCGTQLRSLAQAQTIYLLDNQEYFAGPNTTGWGDVPGSDQDEARYEGETSASTPTSTMDWISPTLGSDLGFSVNRAERTANIFNDFGDPASFEFNDILFGSSGDRADFERVITQGRGFQQVSYMSPGGFQYWPASATSTVRTFIPGQGFQPSKGDTLRQRFGGVPYGRSAGWVVSTPDRYRPLAFRVGTQPSNKVLMMDGTRYLTSEVLDFDVNSVPSTFGSFVSTDPHYVLSTEYGETNTFDGQPIPLSFRHPNESINAGYFDGHVEDMTRREMMSDMTPFYPSGSTVNSFGNLNEITQQDGRWEQGEVIP